MGLLEHAATLAVPVLFGAVLLYYADMVIRTLRMVLA